MSSFHANLNFLLFLYIVVREKNSILILVEINPGCRERKNIMCVFVSLFLFEIKIFFFLDQIRNKKQIRVSKSSETILNMLVFVFLCLHKFSNLI